MSSAAGVTLRSQRAASTAPSPSGWVRAMFRLPRNGVAAFFVIVYWWPLALVIALYALPFILINRLLRIGLRRDMPDRRAVVRWASLIALSAAVYTVALGVFGVPGDHALPTIAVWTAVVSATVALVIPLRRRLARPRVMTPSEVRRYSGSVSQVPDFLSWPSAASTAF